MTLQHLSFLFFQAQNLYPLRDGRESNRAIIAPKNAHLRHKDHWWKPLGYLILAVHWFNPLAWAAFILFCRDTELACDEKVIRNLNKAERIAYSEALLSCSTSRRTLLICPLAFGEVDVKEQRVKCVLNYQKPAFWVVPAAYSNPAEYIQGHQTEYDMLLSYGESTLRYCFAKFLDGGQTDLCGYVMAELWGMERSAALDENEQAWFNRFYATYKATLQNLLRIS